MVWNQHDRIKDCNFVLNETTFRPVNNDHKAKVYNTRPVSFYQKLTFFFVKAWLRFGPLVHLLVRGVIFTTTKIAVVLRTAVKRKR